MDNYYFEVIAFIEAHWTKENAHLRKDVDSLLDKYRRTRCIVFLNEAKYMFIDRPEFDSGSPVPGYVLADTQYNGVSWGFSDAMLPSDHFYGRR